YRVPAPKERRCGCILSGLSRIRRVRSSPRPRRSPRWPALLPNWPTLSRLLDGPNQASLSKKLAAAAATGAKLWVREESHAVGRTVAGKAGAARHRAGVGRRPGQPAQAAHRPPRQAGGFFWRKISHCRFRDVELPQLGNPPDRRADAVQGAQPAASPADGLVVPPPGNE